MTGGRRLNAAPGDEQLLTAGEVAAKFHVSPKTVGAWAAQSKIHSIRTPGGHRRFREQDVRAFLNGEGGGTRLQAAG